MNLKPMETQMHILSRIISRIASRSLARAGASIPTQTHSKHIRTPKMTPEERSELLSAQRVVRIAFDANDERYLIPLGYVWQENALYSMTQRGRKTRMAAVNPRVSFQVDDACDTRLFNYKSVTGEGVFEIVTDAGEIERIMPALASRFADKPDWAQAESAAQWANGELVFVRLRPQVMSGVCYAPPDTGNDADT
jgi:nitroimidazol reductase NimA-like FMN-containing flavoprotein (pyridoxamine 5'-phosphate oxidase superfamily)